MIRALELVCVDLGLLLKQSGIEISCWKRYARKRNSCMELALINAYLGSTTGGRGAISAVCSI